MLFSLYNLYEHIHRTSLLFWEMNFSLYVLYAKKWIHKLIEAINIETTIDTNALFITAEQLQAQQKGRINMNESDIFWTQ